MLVNSCLSKNAKMLKNDDLNGGKNYSNLPALQFRDKSFCLLLGQIFTIVISSPREIHLLEKQGLFGDDDLRRLL